MSQSNIQLSDKTIVLAGAFNPLMQNISGALTEQGADVSLLVPDSDKTQRFCSNLLDLREINPKFGRIAAFTSSLDSDKNIIEALSRTTEAFGSIDSYIDFQLYGSAEDMDVDALIQQCELASTVVTDFLKARARGRFIYLISQNNSSNVAIQDYIAALSVRLFDAQITANGLALGITEDYLLKHFPKAGSISKSLEELKKEKPNARLVDYQEASSVCIFLASGMSTAINGQVLFANHGLN